MVNFSLKDKIAVITGGSRGIGLAIAKGYAESGAQVVLSSRKMADLEKAAKEIEAKGGRAMAIAAHTGKVEDVDRLIDETLKAFGRIDILVNNAVANPFFGSLLEIPLEAWDKVMEVNLRGYFLCARKAAGPMMAQKKGIILNIASQAGLRYGAGMGAYSISKAGVIMLTRGLARELGPYGIRVNALAPGVIETKFSEALWKNPQIRETAEKASSLQRIGQTEEVVGAAIYFASDASSYVTGETLTISGGSLA